MAPRRIRAHVYQLGRLKYKALLGLEIVERRIFLVCIANLIAVIFYRAILKLENNGRRRRHLLAILKYLEPTSGPARMRVSGARRHKSSESAL